MSCKIYNVSGGTGGAVFLLDCGEKTAVHDTGMAYCANKTVENIKKVLGEIFSLFICQPRIYIRCP